MPARNVGINSTFDQQRQVINALAEDIFDGVDRISPTASINTTGIVTATAFYGDGSNLVGVGITRSLTIGTRLGAYVQNAVGTGIEIDLRSGIGTATF
jgi:hypothetical protein